MNAEPVTVRRIGIALAVAAALLTSACAAGQNAGTSEEKPTIDGTNASVGSMDIRGLLIEAPGSGTLYQPGSDATVKLVIVNSGKKPDRLTGITSPAVTDWAAFATPAQADRVVNAHASAAAPTTSSASAAPSTPVASVLPLPTGSRSVLIPPGTRRSWGTPESTGVLLLINLTRPVYPGTTIALTFTFANAGSLTIAAPVGLLSSPQSSIIPTPSTGRIEG